ncbi:methionyl-tRNA formyltransferase [Moorena sp. SIO3A2]|uniref:methionyl-tRNA formyltransferase n=1 Tax=Moorena sp. SIO3A2 TaxID=2607841 RepID=UPI0013BA4D08|nr:methionyl-tRNA formyltransferase [Moorena sp. SIO3A2]NER87931.1 methionyl-tRNA formyltransferase [Moorena sp. SIO3A2]
MRLLFFGDGSWATQSLRRLAQEDWELLGVVTRLKPSDPALLESAQALGLPIFQPKKVNGPEFVAKVATLRPDLNLSVSYDQILRRPILESAPQGFINFHAGKLPFYRGRNVLNWALINGEKEIGLTAHYVNEGIDTGDIILQRTLPIYWTDGYGDLLERVVAAFPDLVANTVSLIANGEVERQPQSHLLGTYFSKRQNGDEWLDWSDSSHNLYNKIRGITHPGPGARTVLDGQMVIVWRAFYDPAWPTYIATPGQVVGSRPHEGIVVKTGDSTLLIQEVQLKPREPCIPNWPIGKRLGINLIAYLQSLEERLAALEK